MNQNELMSKLFGYSAPTYFRWKKEQRPIIKLIDKYFTRKELEEFLSTGEIKKQEQVKKYSRKELEEFLKNEHNINILNQIEELKKGLR